MNCHFDSRQTEGIRETDAPSRLEPDSTSSEASDRVETPEINADDPTTEGGESEDVVIAIGLHRTTGEIEEVIMTMNVRLPPTVENVVARAKREDDSSTLDLRRMLDLIPSRRVVVATAKKLVRVHQVAHLQGKWGDGFHVLGKLEDVEKLNLVLHPCDPCCPEAVDIRTGAKLPASSSAPIFVMYFIETDVSELVLRRQVCLSSFTSGTHVRRSPYTKRLCSTGKVVLRAFRHPDKDSIFFHYE